MADLGRERRWTALRRPDGRLPGRRQTQNVSCNETTQRRMEGD
jgi:hypothetical protein